MARVIDVHAHYLPEECREMVGRTPGLENMRGDFLSLENRLVDMDASGVDMQMVSAFSDFYGRDLATAKKVNDVVAAGVAKHPDRFAGLAVAPLSEPETAAKEMERAVKELGHRGVAIGSNVDGVNLDAPEFGPFFKTVEALGVPIFIHPVNALGADRLAKYELNNFIGFVTDTAVAAGSLIFGGVMKAFPNLKIYLAHGGGTCPFIRGRWDHGWEHRLKGPKIDKAPSEYLKLFYADALVHSKQSLEYVVEVFGEDHIMVGTDYPYDMGHPDQPAWIRDSGFLSTSGVEAILGGTAEKLFTL